jgi:hypothetical protein
MVNKKQNIHQDMYFLYDYKLSTTAPQYNDITIETKYGERNLVIQIPDGKKFFNELTKKMT